MLGSFRMARQSTRRRVSVLDLPTRDRACLRILLRAKVATTAHLTTLVYHRRQPRSSGSCGSGKQASSNAPHSHRSPAEEHLSYSVSPDADAPASATPRSPVPKPACSCATSPCPRRRVLPRSSRSTRSQPLSAGRLVHAGDERPLYRRRHSGCAAGPPARVRLGGAGPGGRRGHRARASDQSQAGPLCRGAG